MSEEHRHNYGGGGPAVGGIIWFIGWLFTIGFANLVWWKILLGLIIWPFYLGEAARFLQ